MFVYFILGLLATNLLTPIDGHHCGKLLENQLYSRNEITAPDEYPWIGRVGYVTENGTSFPCFSVLIHQRYAILTAFCALSNAEFDALFILFGDWRENENFEVRDCRREGNIFQCAAAPQKVDINELVVHPEYKNDIKHNIALAKLERDVEFTDYVQPICLPPVQENDGSHIAQRLEIAGFRRPLREGQEADEEGEWRRKVHVFMASSEFCKSVAYPDWQNLSRNHLCALGEEEKNPLLWITADGNRSRG
ncbi:phenoloxidase-activating factor 1-like [Drosophila gunungcola]|uniref:phenoloxidase-activating factor 1-like n=1 Tax=Drosophila gunungcola TaxID=103775 RepID=UPI0022E6A02F|nr:phenoloxidase-activating factor 1-like [Drosophila gunungcola]